ncbi:MAG: ATP-binding protein [Pseudonocardiales bacterium]
MSAGGFVSGQVQRYLRGPIEEALADTRVVGIVGPRQAGKSTLARSLVAARPNATYVSLDDRRVRIAAEADPHGFVAERPGPLAVDEIQRVPDLLLAIKSVVDLDPRPGRFIITGSSQLSANRGVSETLAGRIERFELWPFSQGELGGRRERFLDLLFDGALGTGSVSSLTKRDYLDLASTGGYPEAVLRTRTRRVGWFDSYVETVVEREAPGITTSPRTGELPRLLRLVAARQATVLNVADLARDARLPERSVYRYLDVLEAVFLVRRIPAWSPNLTQREVRAPKIVLTDPGVAVALRGMDVDALARPEIAQGADGAVLEGFVVAELIRQLGYSGTRSRLLHYRDRERAEVDVIVEAPDGRVAGIEVKSGADVAHRDVRHLATLRDRLGDRFVAGVVLTTGPTALTLGQRLLALPISVLWDSSTAEPPAAPIAI